MLPSKISERFMMPALLLFLGIGILTGSEGIGGIYFDDYGFAKSIGVISLIFIIFSGGLDTKWRAVSPMLFQGLLLSTVGVVLTAVIVGCFAVFLLDFTFPEGLLLGSIVSSTDAAAVFSVLRSRKISLKGYLKPLLEFESGSNDPMAVFLTIGCIGILTKSTASIIDLFPLFVLNMGMGFMIGYIMSHVSIYIINIINRRFGKLYGLFSYYIICKAMVFCCLPLGLLLNKMILFRKEPYQDFMTVLHG